MAESKITDTNDTINQNQSEEEAKAQALLEEKDSESRLPSLFCFTRLSKSRNALESFPRLSI